MSPLLLFSSKSCVLTQHLKTNSLDLLWCRGSENRIDIAFHPRISIRTEQMKQGLTGYIIQISFRVQESRVYFQNRQLKQRRF